MGNTHAHTQVEAPAAQANYTTTGVIIKPAAVDGKVEVTLPYTDGQAIMPSLITSESDPMIRQLISAYCSHNGET